MDEFCALFGLTTGEALALLHVDENGLGNDGLMPGRLIQPLCRLSAIVRGLYSWLPSNVVTRLVRGPAPALGGKSVLDIIERGEFERAAIFLGSFTDDDAGRTRAYRLARVSPSVPK